MRSTSQVVSAGLGPHSVVELGEARGKTLDGKPNPSIICPELRELGSNSVDFKDS